MMLISIGQPLGSCSARQRAMRLRHRTPRGLRRAHPAYSSGAAEDHVNRPEVIERQMYPSSNLVADRLRELEGRGVIDRGKLPAPASSWVCELAAWARDLEPILLALGGWGMRVPLPPSGTLSATSVMLFLRSSARPDPGASRPPAVSNSATACGPSGPGPDNCVCSQANPPALTPPFAPIPQRSTPCSKPPGIRRRRLRRKCRRRGRPAGPSPTRAARSASGRR